MKAKSGINHYQQQAIKQIRGTQNPPYVKLYVYWRPGKIHYEVRLFNLENAPVKSVKFTAISRYEKPIDYETTGPYLPEENISEIPAHSNILVYNDSFSYGLEEATILFEIKNQNWKYFFPLYREKEWKVL